eukprot:2113772-Pleurochrysis_carterae.AAC.4
MTDLEGILTGRDQALLASNKTARWAQTMAFGGAAKQPSRPPASCCATQTLHVPVANASRCERINVIWTAFIGWQLLPRSILQLRCVESVLVALSVEAPWRAFLANCFYLCA